MRITRFLAAGALALTLAVAGCSSNGDAPEPDATPTATDGDEGPEDQTGTDDPGTVTSGLNPDAHPFCAVLVEFNDLDGDDDEFTPTEADLPRLKELSDKAIAAAPAGIEDEVELYFTTMVSMAEEMISSGAPEEMDLEDMDQDLQEAFGAVFGFAFETCLDIDFDLEENAG